MTKGSAANRRTLACKLPRLISPSRETRPLAGARRAGLPRPGLRGLFPSLREPLDSAADQGKHQHEARCLPARPARGAKDACRRRHQHARSHPGQAAAEIGELQPLKNSRLIGENHLGLLEVRNPAPGEYGDYVRETVDAENKDRMALMDLTAKAQKNFARRRGEAAGGNRDP